MIPLDRGRSGPPHRRGAGKCGALLPLALLLLPIALLLMVASVFIPPLRRLGA